MADVLYSVETIIDFIESNLFSDFDLGIVSKKVFVSKYHMLRLFKQITGLGIMEYATLRRLSISVYALLYTKQDIGYIANSHCFSCRQSYIRAFKRQFSITPMTYRKNPFKIRNS